MVFTCFHATNSINKCKKKNKLNMFKYVALLLLRNIYRMHQSIQTIIFVSMGKQDRPFIYVFWNQLTLRLKIQSCVNKKSSFFHLILQVNNGE